MADALVEMNRRINDLAARITGLENRVRRPFTYGEYISILTNMPNCRGCWSFGSLDNAGNIYDSSGQGRTLTYTGNPVSNTNLAGVPRYDLDGAADYFTRADEAGLDIIGNETYVTASKRGLTYVQWMFFNQTNAIELVAGKLGASGQYSWFLQKETNDKLLFVTSSNGTATTPNILTPSVLTIPGHWHFIACRYTPSTEIKIWLDDNSNANVTSIPATLVNSTGAFTMGYYIAGAAQSMYGGLSAAALYAGLLTDDQIRYLYNYGRILYGV